MPTERHLTSVHGSGHMCARAASSICRVAGRNCVGAFRPMWGSAGFRQKFDPSCERLAGKYRYSESARSRK